MTPTIINAKQLDEYIAELEVKKNLQEVALKNAFHKTIEDLKPSNLLKSAWHQVTTSPEIKDSIVDNGLGLAAGFVSKKILVGSSHNPIKRLLGSLAQYGITNLVANHPDPLKSIGKSLLGLMLKNKNKK